MHVTGVSDRTKPELKPELCMSPLVATLLASRQYDQMTAARAMYMNVPDDHFLYGFRKAANMPTPGTPMGGWCSGTSAVIFGQIISGLVRLGAATGDTEAVDKAIRLFKSWRETAGPEGDAKMITYGWDKLMGGLVDLATCAGQTDAMDYAKLTTQWASRTFDRSRTPASALDWDGRHPNGTLEWYTLGEHLYRAYLHTGEDTFRSFGDVWQYPAFWNKFAHTSRPKDAHAVHAYSHVNSLCSLAALYEVTADKKQLQTLVNAAEHILETQCYATGGYGPWERLVADDGQLSRALDMCCDHAEVGCGSWAVFKLCTYLLRFTGDAKWGDWIERVVYNLIGAAMPVQPDGRTTYYVDYRPSSGAKIFYESAWPCCSGTYLQAVAAYNELAYFAGTDDALNVTLYLPSEVVHQVKNQSVKVRQETTYPDGDTSQFTITCDQPAEFAMRLRIPAWCNGATATVNGQITSGVPGEWLVIKRMWKTGDVLTITLPMLFRLEPVDAQHLRRCAVMRGPVVFAQNGRYMRPLLTESEAELNARIERGDNPMWFKVKDVVKKDLETGWLRPLWDFPEQAPYRVYHDLDEPFIY
jgi:uncharacterized protein